MFAAVRLREEQEEKKASFRIGVRFIVTSREKRHNMQISIQAQVEKQRGHTTRSTNNTAIREVNWYE